MRGFESKRNYSEIPRLRVDSECWAVTYLVTQAPRLRWPTGDGGGAYVTVPCLVSRTTRIILYIMEKNWVIAFFGPCKIAQVPIFDLVKISSWFDSLN